MDSECVLSSRVRLARNYDDLPFRTEGENAEACIRRTTEALARAGEGEGYTLVRLAELSDVQRRVLA